MGVTITQSGGGNNNGSNASTTVTFVSPITVTVGDLWVCSASFRGGSGAVISGVPAAFTLVARTDSGSASANDVLVTYTYVPNGTEISNASFASITISGSSKYGAMAVPLSGANLTTPVVGSVVTAVGTTTATTTALSAFSSGQLALALAGQQGDAFVPTIVNANADQLGVGSVGLATSGGSAASNVGSTGWYVSSDTSSQTWTVGHSASTCVIQVFIVDAAVTATPSLVYDDRRIRRNILSRL